MAVVRHDRTKLTCDIAAWILTGVALVLILSLHLLPALLAGLLVYELVHILAPRLKVVRIHQEYGKLVAVAMLATIVVLGIVLAIIGIMAFLHSEAGNLPRLLKKMADILDSWRAVLPASLSAYLPEDIDALKDLLVEGLHGHAGALQKLGAEAGRTGAQSSSGWGLVHSSPSTKRALGKPSDHWPALCKSGPSDSARHSGVLCLHKCVFQPSIRGSRLCILSSYCPCLGHISRSPRR